MKELEIIINGDKLDRVEQLLSRFSRSGIFVTQGFGYGHQQGFHQVYTRDDNRGVKVLPKVSVRTVVSDDKIEPIVDRLVAELGSATFGDGKIFIRDVTDAVRVRTGERGDEAL
ncbi:P-II family nitrogen regulator [Collinsella stercoris]|uniref:Nitrogen regulatory protein P-II n=1 Tax=Collinsella stercoris DSM 13279 TaxID=445975 RepID=B6G927_9ACTN|nr:P-II family nitrogen regulator [Collinsella stercoris]EEA91224.1 nitrogen regulatory protein P-II [Collinsella stercoris DSM 13279]UEA44602.1 P-II family nitrogen regulator [Collinsella stercoris DSM 13279]UWP10934.1 P-II family nitrogen regulator [Collinsella stercoris]